MANLLCQVEIPGNCCVGVIELPPAVRQVSCRGAWQSVRFPYSYFAVEYRRVAGGLVRYRSMCVCYSELPFRSFNDKILASNLDAYCVTCLPHQWDEAVFPDFETLAGTVIGVWRGMSFPVNRVVFGPPEFCSALTDLLWPRLSTIKPERTPIHLKITQEPTHL